MRVPKPGNGAWIIQLHASTRQSDGGVDGHLVLRIVHPGRRGEPLDAATLSERLGLSSRQAQAVAALVKNGAEDSASAELRISKATLHTHVTRAYDHLGVHSRAALVALLARHGFDLTPGGENM
jgi:DNA-binding NarL/FixJ family response regulator